MGRCRYVEGEKDQFSSICKGSFQGSGVFQSLLLTEERLVTSNGERIVSPWKNPSLTVTAKYTQYPVWRNWEAKDGLVPASWFPGSGKKGKLAFVEKQGTSDTFLQFTGVISQAYMDSSQRTIPLRIRIRAAGKGKMTLGIPRYSLEENGSWKFRGPDGKNLKGKNPVELTEEFKEYTWEYTKRPGEFFALSVYSAPEGFVQLDEAVITPVQ